MNVSEGVFCVPSQYREGKAHIVKILECYQDIEVPGNIPDEAQNLLNISNCSARHEEFINKTKDLLHRLTLYSSGKETIYECTCPDYKYNGGQDCKHILAVKLNQGEI
jgi:hypothetical protein